MRIIIDLLRRIVDKYDKKKGLRKKTIHMCHSWDTRNRYKLPEWQTKKGEPLCPIYKDDRCCGSCDLATTCDHATNCNCYGFALSVLGGTTEREYMRKCSPYYKYGRMKSDGTFDWDFYNMNKSREEFVPGKYVKISKHEELGVSEDVLNTLKEKGFKVGVIIEKMDEEGHLKLNFNKDNNGEDFIIDVHFKGLGACPYQNYEIAKMFS